jgi:hypothetical protein
MSCFATCSSICHAIGNWYASAGPQTPAWSAITRHVHPVNARPRPRGPLFPPTPPEIRSGSHPPQRRIWAVRDVGPPDSTYVTRFQLRQMTDVSLCNLQQHLSCNRQRAARLPARAFPAGGRAESAALCTVVPPIRGFPHSGPLTAGRRARQRLRDERGPLPRGREAACEHRATPSRDHLSDEPRALHAMAQANDVEFTSRQSKSVSYSIITMEGDGGIAFLLKKGQ